MTRRARRRLRTALVMVLCLLIQQVSVAAFACAMERPTPLPMAVAMPMGEHCAEMAAMPQPPDNPVLCEKHCNPDHGLTVDVVKLSVPPLALPPAAFEPVMAVQAIATRAPDETAFVRSDPPPRLRFCSLLI